MIRVFLLALLAVSALLSILPSAGFAQGDDDEDEEDIDDYIEEVIAAADAFWSVQAPPLGIRYTTPDVRSVEYDERVNSRCGKSRGTNHSYCPAESRIYLDYDSEDGDSLEALWDDDRAFVIVTIVGHEWGHHIQKLAGILNDPKRTSVEIELQADCFMGVFTRAYQNESDWVERADVRDAILSTTESGDDEGTPPNELTHGTADQRLSAFFLGYRGSGVRVCGI